MSHHAHGVYQRVDEKRAATLMLSAEAILGSMGLPEWFVPKTLERIHQAVSARQADGLPVDVTSRTEVDGLVRAAMGDNDHLEPAHRELATYTVGLVQTPEEVIQQARSELEQYLFSNVGA